jgi:nucleoside-diphosphate-sugar epimerase
MSSFVLGAGLVGRAVVRQLVERGEPVIVASRSATPVPGARAVAVDASDPQGLTVAAAGASTIYLCTNPPYPEWARRWPPMFAAVIETAKRTGADLVAMGNLYPYGRAAMPMTERSPELATESKGLIRKAGWAAMRAAHERGEFRAVEIRASDYFGPGATATAHLGARFFVPLLAGKRAGVVGDPAVAHSWAYLADIAATLIAASGYRGTWGRIWHVPSSSDLDRDAIAAQLRERYGSGGRVYGFPQWLLRSLGAFSPLMREVHASSYQFAAPFISDAGETERELGVSATAWDEALAATVESYRQ